MKQKWLKKLFRRRIFVILLIALQIAVILYLVVSGTRTSVYVSMGLNVLSLLAALHAINWKGKAAYKLIWVFLILLFPVFGGLFYLLFRVQSSPRKFQKKLSVIVKKSQPLFLLPGDEYEEACKAVPDCVPQIDYLQKFAGFPVYQNTKTKYLSPGEEKFKCLLEKLRDAKRYIFLEYFIIHEGIMWNSILKILKEKVKEGVEVRVMYDDMGCFLLLPNDYPRQLRSCGIQCTVFNSFRPRLSSLQNNRDHRKIAVIDGTVAFTGGINLADEYINACEKYGHWKDASIMVEGKAAWSFTLIFLQMWEICNNTKEDYRKYYTCGSPNALVKANDGFVQPYADSPTDRENVGEHVYLQMINNAKRYVYISTPYLIIDDSMLSALTLAAKSGVDVRIVTPHQPDKWFVHMTTRSYYRELIDAGVKIYEYSQGFIHSKTFVSDDKSATVGTTNMDFRSLYLHFECGVRLYGSKAVKEVYEDFIATLDECQQITMADCRGHFLIKCLQNIFRLFAPLM